MVQSCIVKDVINEGIRSSYQLVWVAPLQTDDSIKLLKTINLECQS